MMELQKQCNVYVNESFDASGEKIDDHVKDEKSREKAVVNEKINAHGPSGEGKISYIETLMHLFKGNVGSGNQKWF